jgi:hypothetical protein
MDSIFCTKCLKFKDKNQFSKAQQRKKCGSTCLNCVAQSVPQKNSPVESLKEMVPTSPSRLFKPLYGVEGDKADQMICLTMHQPWASLLVYGIKRAEGRGWTTDFRGRLWIHAGTILCHEMMFHSCKGTNTRNDCRLRGEIS